MARARFIVLQPANRFVALYGRDASRPDLDKIVKQLQRNRGVEARVALAAPDSPAAPPALVILRVASGTSAEPIVREFRRLTNPEMPYTLSRLYITLMWCDCGYVSTVCGGQFVRGLAPDDQEAFWQKFYAQLQRRADYKLKPSCTVLPEASISGVVEKAIQQAGAYPSETSISVEIDTRPCCHSR